MRALSLALCLGLLSACGGSDDHSSAATGGAGGTGASGGAAGSGGSAGRSPVCVEQDTLLQSALDGARAKTGSKDAAMAVTTPACGSVTYVSGESGLTGSELFRIGSVTKTYVAAVVLGLVGAGKLSLDDELEQWVSGVPNGSTITVRMLLNHTSGIFNYTEDPSVLSDLTKQWTPEELVAAAAAHGAVDPPGTKWKYSNTNYVCLGIIAEKVGGKGIAEQIRAELLLPGKLEHTFFDGEEALGGALAPGFATDGTDVTTLIDPSLPWAAGAMTATPADTAKWIERLATGNVLAPAQQAEMEKGEQVAPNVSYGLGLLMLGPALTAGAGQGFGHDGSIDGYHTQAFHFRESKTTIVSIVNQDGADPNEITLAALLSLFNK